MNHHDEDTEISGHRKTSRYQVGSRIQCRIYYSCSTKEPNGIIHEEDVHWVRGFAWATFPLLKVGTQCPLRVLTKYFVVLGGDSKVYIRNKLPWPTKVYTSRLLHYRDIA